MGRISSWLGRLLSAVPPSESAGLRLQGPSWEVEGHGVAPPQFFRALQTLLMQQCFLSIEGGLQPVPVREFFERHAVPPAANIARGTVWPRATLCHIPAEASVLRELADLAERCASPELCDHLHVYNRERVLLQWYDAFSDPFYISKSVPLDRIETFCRALRTSFTEARANGA